MPKPQYNVKQTDTGSKNYYKPAIQPAGVYNWSSMPQIHYSPMPNLPVPTPKVNPLKYWWNNIVNNARQNPNTLYSNPFGVNAYSAPVATPPVYPAPVFRTKYNSRTYPTSPNTFNTVNNINRGLNSPFGKPSTYPKPNQNAIGQYTDTDNRNRVLSWEEIAQLPDYGRPPQEENAYQEGVWVANPEVPAGGGYGGYGGGGSYDYFSRPSSPSYTGYGGSGYLSMPSSPNYTGYGNGYYSMPSSGGYGGGGGSGYYSMPQAPNYTGYGRSGYASMPQAPTYRGRGGRNQSIAPATAYYRGINSGGGYGGGYAGGQSQRSSWYGSLLQWNI